MDINVTDVEAIHFIHRIRHEIVLFRKAKGDHRKVATHGARVFGLLGQLALVLPDCTVSTRQLLDAEMSSIHVRIKVQK